MKKAQLRWKLTLISSAADVYSKRFLPSWAYDDVGGPKTPAKAMAELTEIVKAQPGFTIIKTTDNVRDLRHVF